MRAENRFALFLIPLWSIAPEIGIGEGFQGERTVIHHGRTVAIRDGVVRKWVRQSMAMRN